MDTDTTATAGPQTADDEVLALAVRIFDAFDREEGSEGNAATAKLVRDFTSEIYNTAAKIDAFDEYYALKATLPYVRATTLTGAAIHLNEAMSVADTIRDIVKEVGKDEEAGRYFRVLDRLLWSVFDVVDSRAEIKAANLHQSMPSRCLNPWTPVEQRLEIVRAN